MEEDVSIAILLKSLPLEDYGQIVTTLKSTHTQIGRCCWVINGRRKEANEKNWRWRGNETRSQSARQFQYGRNDTALLFNEVE